MNNRRILALQSDAATKLPLSGGTMTGELVAAGGIQAAQISIEDPNAIVITADQQVPSGAYLRIEVNGTPYRIMLLNDV